MLFLSLLLPIIRSICSGLFLKNTTVPVFFLIVAVSLAAEEMRVTREVTRGGNGENGGNAVTSRARDARATATLLDCSLSSPLSSLRRCAESKSAGSAPRLGALRPGRAPFPCVPALSSRRN